MVLRMALDDLFCCQNVHTMCLFLPGYCMLSFYVDSLPTCHVKPPISSSPLLCQGEIMYFHDHTNSIEVYEILVHMVIGMDIS